MVDNPDVSVAALRRLAHGLLYDPHGAEDVVQEAWLAALGLRATPPRLGAWLTESVKRLARNRRRDEARRQAREQRAARSEELPGADERAVQLELLHRLLDALGRLEEPYRSAVMLRILDDLPPREIGRRLGVPVNTVRTHVRRGLERLRRDLDGEHGRGREELLAALVPFAGERPWKLTAPAASKLALATSMTVLVGVSWFAWRVYTASEGAAPELARTAGSPGPNEGASSPPEPTPNRGNAREPVGTSSAALNARSWVVRGHAFGALDEPYPHLALVGRVHTGPKAEGVPLVEERFETDAAGNFWWALEPPADLVTVSVEPEIERHTNLGVEAVFLPGDPAPERCVVTAYPLDSVVRGTIRDPDGLPVPHTLVTSFQGWDLRTTCDEMGRFTLAQPTGSPEFWPEELLVSAPGFAAERIEVELHVGEVLVPDVILRRDLRVRGRVLGPEGEAVEGAEVNTWLGSEQGTRTDATGAFELGQLDPAEERTYIEVARDGYAEASKELTRAELESAIEIRLRRAVRVSGRMLAPGGSPVWGALVTVGDGRLDGELCNSPRWGYSDREGHFTIENVPPGRQRFWVERRGFAQARVAVDIPRNVTEHEVELELAEVGHFLAGILLDHEGKPVPWASVQATDRTGIWEHYADDHSGADGCFRLEGLPRRRVHVRVFLSGLTRIDEAFPQLDRDDLVLRMAPTSHLSGRVVEAETGEPVASFVVKAGAPPLGVWDPGERRSFSWPGPREFTTADGRWTMETECAPGQPLSLEVEAEGHVLSSIELVHTSLSPSPDELVIRMVRTTTVRGRVLAKGTGAPLEGARVRWMPPGKQLEYFTSPFEDSTDAAGRFQLTNVPLGEMQLAVEAQEHALAVDGPFSVVDSTPIERSIELASGATLRGRLLDWTGNALAGEEVELEANDGAQRDREWTATTDAEGAFEFAHLAPGTYTLGWERYRDEEWLWWLRQTVELATDELVETVLIPSGRATLCGTVEFDGELPAGEYVWIRPVASEPRDPARLRWSRTAWAVPLDNGRFCLEHLEPGEYMVSIEFGLGVIDPEDPFDEGDGYAYGEERVSVPVEGTAEVRVIVEGEER